MAIKIYLAARYSRYPEMQKYKKLLEELGFIVTSRWIDGHHLIAKGLTDDNAEMERVRFAKEDLHDLFEAKWLICFTEIPRSTNTRGGRHVEFGIALAMRMRIFVIGPKETIFHTLPTLHHYESFAGLFKELMGGDPEPITHVKNQPSIPEVAE